jgi:hypothetical protein
MGGMSWVDTRVLTHDEPNVVGRVASDATVNVMVNFSDVGDERQSAALVL